MTSIYFIFSFVTLFSNISIEEILNIITDYLLKGNMDFLVIESYSNTLLTDSKSSMPIFYDYDNYDGGAWLHDPYSLPWPASEKMNSLVLLYMEVNSTVFFIFLIVYVALSESIFNFNSFEYQYECRKWMKSIHLPYARHFTKEEEHFIDMFVILIPTIIVLQIIVPTLGYLYNEELLYYDTFISFDVNIIGNQWFWSAPSNLIYRCVLVHISLVTIEFKRTSLSNVERLGECSMLVKLNSDIFSYIYDIKQLIIIMVYSIKQSEFNTTLILNEEISIICK